MYDNQNSVCGICYNSQNYFFLKNLQGDIIAITNSDGEIIARYSYDSWGVCTVNNDNPVATINPFRYRGYYYDAEIGMYYLQSRYYDPNTGRFINADSPEYAAVTGNNLFAYCGNNPVMNVDYFGFCCLPDDYPCYADRQEPGIIETFLKSFGLATLVLSLFGYGIFNDLADFQEKYPNAEDVLSWLDAFFTVAKFFYPPLVIVETIIEIIDIILTISKRKKSKADWLQIIADILIKIFDLDFFERFGKFSKGKYDEYMNYLYVL